MFSVNYTIDACKLFHLMHKIITCRESLISGGRKRCYDTLCEKSIAALEPPHKKQKISHANNIEQGKERREYIDCKQLLTHLSNACDKKGYIETCVKTILLSVPGEDYEPDDMDENELINASKLACTLLFETIGNCEDSNTIVNENNKNDICKILAVSPMGCKWFLKKLLAVNDNHWLRVLYEQKYNFLGDIVTDFVITALKCVRKHEYKYYKQALKITEQNENKHNNNGMFFTYISNDQ